MAMSASELVRFEALERQVAELKVEVERLRAERTPRPTEHSEPARRGRHAEAA